MSGWLLWVVAACVFGVGEMLTTGFFLAPFALGAVVAAVVEAIGAGEVISVGMFVLASVLTLALVRPIAISHQHQPPQLRTGARALIGKQAVVLERIVNDEGVGCIRVEGEVWTARAFDDDQVIERGTRVEIIDIRGATALVTV
jgi:membrane protein implicated in regulation of membrane protease activity